MGFPHFYRDHYCEGAVIELLKRGVLDPSQTEIFNVCDNYCVYCEVEAGVEFLSFEEKLNANSLPDDFSDIKAYFKRMMNDALIKKWKTKVLKNQKFNSIAINMLEDRGILLIGIMLTQKAVGVDIVYEGIDGIYIKATALNPKSVLYGLEIQGAQNACCFVGPEFMIQGGRGDEGTFHIMIDFNLLSENKCELITSINFIMTSSAHNVQYGDRGDVFTDDFPDIGLGH